MRIIPVVFCLYLFVACSVSPAPLNTCLEAIQRDCDAGRIRQAQIAVAQLKDLSADQESKRLVAVKQLDIQNMYCLCFNRGFDTAREYMHELNGPDNDPAALSSAGFCLYLAAILRNEPTADSAASKFKAANALYVTRGDKAGQALTCFYEALCYQNNPDTTKNDALSAERLIREALRLSTEVKDKKVQSYAYRHLAGICVDRHQTDSALVYAFISYRLREECGWWALRPFTLELIGDIYQSINADSSKKYHLQALRFADTLGYPVARRLGQAVIIDDSLLLQMPPNHPKDTMSSAETFRQDCSKMF